VSASLRSRHGCVALVAAILAACCLISACSSKTKTRVPAPPAKVVHPSLRIDTLWTRDVGDGAGKYYSNLRVAVGDQRLYAASVDGRVIAVDAATGKLLWRQHLRQPNAAAGKYEFWKKKKDTPVIAGPSVDGDLLLLGTLDAQVIALNRADGKPRWKAPGSSELMAPPTGNQEIVVANAVDGHVYGLSATEGAQLWNFDRSTPALTLRGLSAPLIIDNRLYIGLDNGHLVGLNLADGQPIWDEVISQPTGRTELERLTDIDADLLAGPEGLYVVSYGGDIALVDPASGQPVWRRTVKSYTGMALSDKLLIVTDSDGFIWAFDSASGVQAWKQEGLKYRTLSPPAVADGYAVVGDHQGYLYWLSLDDGHFVARDRLGGKPIHAPLVAADGALYAMDRSGKIGAFRAKPR
jgi:outer membrane protein assembly factor BamB